MSLPSPYMSITIIIMIITITIILMATIISVITPMIMINHKNK